jgi:preprotein translocase subunit SecY
MTSELARRIAFTLGALLVYRLGVYIPVPGVDLTVWARLFDQNAGGVLSQANALSGGAVRALGIFSISLTPYVTVAVLLQLLALVSRRLRALAASERGRRTVERWTLYPALVLTVFQSYGIALGLENFPGLVANPGPLFVASTVLTLTGGTLLLIWLSGQITSRGIGNGIALIFFVGIATQLPGAIANMLLVGRMGLLSPAALLAVLLLAVATTAFCVAMERARRRLPVQFPERQVGARTLASQSVDLAVKLNPAGIIPAILASAVLGVALGFAILLGGDSPNGIAATLSQGRTLPLAITAALVVLFTFIYTAFVDDPARAAESLETRGGVIPNIAPGEATAEHLDGVLTRIATIAAAYLAFLVLLPELMIGYLAVPIYFGGIPLLVLVCTTLDIEAQVRAHLAHPG